jgi:hypothetical protein
MQSIARLADEIFLDKVRAARSADPAEKFLDGPRLFDYACRLVESGIRNQNPEASEEQIHRLLLQRIEIMRQLERN